MKLIYSVLFSNTRNCNKIKNKTQELCAVYCVPKIQDMLFQLKESLSFEAFSWGTSGHIYMHLSFANTSGIPI